MIVILAALLPFPRESVFAGITVSIQTPNCVASRRIFLSSLPFIEWLATERHFGNLYHIQGMVFFCDRLSQQNSDLLICPCFESVNLIQRVLTINRFILERIILEISQLEI